MTFTLDDEKNEVVNTLDLWMKQKNVPLYAVYYKGKQITISKRRVYIKQGAAKAQICRCFRQMYFGTYPHGQLHKPQHVKEIIDDMIKDGTIEIKPI